MSEGKSATWTAEDAGRLRTQRVDGRGAIAIGLVAGRPRLARLHQRGAAKIRLPANDSGPMEAILINTAGGLTGGDRLAWEAAVADGAAMVVTTQACEKIYRASDGIATLDARLSAGRGARIAWLPQETILFEGSALHRRLEVDLSQGATALVIEAAILGRRAMGETVEKVTFSDRWRVRRNGRLVHAEDFLIGPAAAPLRRAAALGANEAFATLLLVDDEGEDKLDRARAIVGDAGGASFWRVGGTGKLLARIRAADGYALRARLGPLVELLNGQAALPKVWSL